MISTVNIDKTEDKATQYAMLLEQVKVLTASESNRIANLGNICSLLKYEMDWYWVGFYVVDGDELVLNCFQGTLACTRIAKGKGVCGLAWERNETIVVEDVNAFDGHIACSTETQSEIVLPVRNKRGDCIAVLDVDSEQLSTFDETDAKGLETIVKHIETLF